MQTFFPISGLGSQWPKYSCHKNEADVEHVIIVVGDATMGGASTELFTQSKPAPPPDHFAFRAALVLVLVFFAPRTANSWGNQAHQLVNARAVENLPEPLRTYFRARQSYLIDHASDPDTLSGEDAAERPHHYTDAEAYDKEPFAKLRKQFVDEDRPPTTVEARNGDSIWQIEKFTLQLASALRRRNWEDADRAAVFAAHYACDLTQPLHTVVNYDGQFTRQAGIHSRFESEMVNAL